MHGRRKEFNSEQVALARKKKEARLVQEYQQVCAHWRESSPEYSGDDAMGKTERSPITAEDTLTRNQHVLQKNPEFYSAWNDRRRTLLKYAPSLDQPQTIERIQQELQLTQECIQIFPKSYWTWYQRRWLLEVLFPQHADWKRELKLCNKLLDLDGRNFHCWDYRRFVVQEIMKSDAPVSTEEELQFTMKKITQNFSNYSAWHYRSRLLPTVNPQDPSDGYLDVLERGRIIADPGIRSTPAMLEFDLIKSAIFTEPGDQSAWLYHRWLCSQVTSGVVVQRALWQNHPETRVGSLTLYFDDVVKWCEDSTVDGTAHSWKTMDGRTDTYADTWSCFIAASAAVQELVIPAKAFHSRSGFDSEEYRFSVPVEPFHWLETSRETQRGKQILERELLMVEELLEVEPDSPLCLLTAAMLRRRLGKAIGDQLKDAEHADPMRKGFYGEFGASVALEQGAPPPPSVGHVCRSIPRRAYLCSLETLDLSGSPLGSMRGLLGLPCLRELSLDRCSISQIPALWSLSRLQKLAIRDNMLATIESLHGLATAAQLQELRLDGNPVVTLDADDAFDRHVAQLIPGVCNLNGQPVTPDPERAQLHRWMIEAIRLSYRSKPVDTAYCVGALIVEDTTNHVAATGYSRELPGNTHAEQCALMKLVDSRSTGGTGTTAISSSSSSTTTHRYTLFTTMEPCSRRLSGSMSCTERLLQPGSPPIHRIVVGSAEPPHFVAQCEGMKQLAEHGIEICYLSYFQSACLAANEHVRFE